MHEKRLPAKQLAPAPKLPVLEPRRLVPHPIRPDAHVQKVESRSVSPLATPVQATKSVGAPTQPETALKRQRWRHARPTVVPPKKATPSRAPLADLQPAESVVSSPTPVRSCAIQREALPVVPDLQRKAPPQLAGYVIQRTSAIDPKVSAVWAPPPHKRQAAPNAANYTVVSRTLSAAASAKASESRGQITIPVTRMAQPVQASPVRCDAPDSPLEREAESVAQQIAKDPAPRSSISRTGIRRANHVERLNGSSAVDGGGFARSPRQELTSTPRHQATHSVSTTKAADSTFETELHRARSSGGEAMPDAARRFMEPRFGQDFGGVRVHRDDQAHALAAAAQARAFTVGRDVFFGKGEFESGTERGHRLIAHELTHVVQQRQGARTVQRQPRAPDVRSLEVGDITRARIRLQLGKHADLKVVAGTIPSDAQVQVLEVAENSGKLRVGLLRSDQVVEPRGWTLSRFLGSKERSARNTQQRPTDDQLVRRLTSLVLEQAAHGEEAVFSALDALRTRVSADEFIAVALAVDLELGLSRSQNERVLTLLQPRNVFGSRAPGAVIPLFAGAAQQLEHRLQAFGKGLVEGLKSKKLSDEELTLLLGNLAKSQLLNLVTFNQIFLAGAVKGAYDEVAGVYKLLVQLFDDPEKMLNAIAEFIGHLLNEDSFAYALGYDIGQSFDEDLRRLSSENFVKFTFDIGKLAGPVVIAIVLMVITEGLGAAFTSLAARLPTVARLLKKLPGKGLERVKTLAQRLRHQADTRTGKQLLHESETKPLELVPEQRRGPATEGGHSTPQTPPVVVPPFEWTPKKLLERGYTVDRIFMDRVSHRIPAEGWKLHITADSGSAKRLAELVLPRLESAGVNHKVVRSLEELEGMSRAQAGKFITIYPDNAAHAKQLVAGLDDHLGSRGFSGPSVDGEALVGNSGLIYSRYGGFTKSTVTHPSGGEVPDVRGQIAPPWIENIWENPPGTLPSERPTVPPPAPKERPKVGGRGPKKE